MSTTDALFPDHFAPQPEESSEHRAGGKPDCPRCNQLHRRAQLAEAALAAVEPERLAQAGRSGGSFGRSALRWAATKATKERDEARRMAEELARALTEVLTQGPPSAGWKAVERYLAWLKGQR